MRHPLMKPPKADSNLHQNFPIITMIQSLSSEAKVVISNENEDAVEDSDPIRDEHSGDNEEVQGVEYLVSDGEAGRKTAENDAELIVMHDEEENVAKSGESGHKAQTELLNEPNTVSPSQENKEVCPAESLSSDNGAERRDKDQILVKQYQEVELHLDEGQPNENSIGKESETQDPESEKQETECSKTENSESDISASENVGAERNQASGSDKDVNLLGIIKLQDQVQMQVGDIKVNELSRESDLTESGDTEAAGNEAEESAQEDSLSTALTEVLSKALTKVVSQVMTRVMKKAVKRVLTRRAMSSLMKKIVTRVLTKALERSLSKI